MSNFDRPNFVFLHSHNTGRHIEPYGYATPTPALQQLAQRGVMFRYAFAAAPTCSPSRASFLTGLCPHTAGMLGLSHRGFGCTHYPQHLCHRLSSVGYQSVLCGIEHTVLHHGGDTPYAGYDHVLGPNLSAAKKAGPAVADFLRRAPTQPFFLSVGLRETHTPFAQPDPANHRAEDHRYCHPPSPLPDTPQTRRDTAGFNASARLMDQAYGQIIDTLDQTGLSKNTFVFCFSDHGLQFPLNMCNLTDHGLGVYLIAHGPGEFQGGKVIDAMVSLLDLVPTCCELAGGGGGPGPGVGTQPTHGCSLLPLVQGRTDQLHDALFGEVTFHAAYEPQRSVRTTRYKYIRRYDKRKRVVLPNTDDCVSKNMLLKHGWLDQPRDEHMLFDLIFDPDERHNIAGRPDMATTLTGMQHRLDQWMRKTNDPLLPDGFVPPPSGSKTNDPDGQSPTQPPALHA